jgi:putative ABC transport system substrate-binding protein
MRRRAFITLAAAAIAAPVRAKAQTQALPVVGFLHPGFPTYPGGGAANVSLAGLKDGLRERGYVDGETMRIEARWGRGQTETLTGFAQELVALKADVIVAVARPSIEASKSCDEGAADCGSRSRKRSGGHQLRRELGDAGPQSDRPIP